jgi:hypothetical protein
LSARQSIFHFLFSLAGLFIENLLLGFHLHGLGACPQYSIAAYAPTVRDVLGLQDARHVVCGIRCVFFVLFFCFVSFRFVDLIRFDLFVCFAI